MQDCITRDKIMRGSRSVRATTCRSAGRALHALHRGQPVLRIGERIALNVHHDLPPKFAISWARVGCVGRVCSTAGRVNVRRSGTVFNGHIFGLPYAALPSSSTADMSTPTTSTASASADAASPLSSVSHDTASLSLVHEAFKASANVSVRRPD